MKKASKVETSDTQMGVVIECSYKPKTQYLANTPVFTDEARQLLAQSPDAVSSLQLALSALTSTS